VAAAAQVVILCILACEIGFAAGFCKLVAAGSTLSVAGDTADFFFDLFYGKSLYQFWNRLQVAVAAAGEFYIVYDISLKLQFD
jgi:hypothetical protein